MRVSTDRIAARISRLAEFVDPNQPSFTRRAFTPVYLEARKWLANEMTAAGLECRLDRSANLIGSYSGKVTQFIGLGSHIDTVNAGGRFDGVAGVVAALEVAQVLLELKVSLNFGLLIIDFLSEEPSDYGLSCIGSRAFAGMLDVSALERRNSTGETLREAIRRMGGSPEEIGGSPLMSKNAIRAFLELHIEQGPILEDASSSLGVVTGINGIRRYALIITGEPGHSGTTPMLNRKDALVAAAEIIGLVRATAIELNRQSTFVGTVGSMSIAPNSANVIPGRVELVVEARAMSQDALDHFERRLKHLSDWVCKNHRVSHVIEPTTRSEPTECSSELRALLVAACGVIGAPYLELPSGAGHDAQQMAALCPAAMLFVPSKGGVSHNPAEATDFDDIALGAEALLESVLALNSVAS